MLEVRLSWNERKLLEVWLPHESELGAEQTDARSLVAMWQTLSPADVADRLAKVRRHLGELRTERSLLDAPAPIGRGTPIDAHLHADHRIGSAWPSPWEIAWLTVDRLASRGELLSGVRPAELETETMLDAAAIAILCVDSAATGRELSRALAADPECTDVDRAWLAWLGGDEDVALADALDDDVTGESPQRSLAAALRGDWAEAEARLPKPLRKLQTRAIKPSGRMHGQLLAQLVAHVQTGSPTREIVEQSLAVLFKLHAQSSYELQTRLPLLALYRRHLAPGIAACELLHAQRRHNEHLVQPPPRTYVAPDEVLGALARLESILAAAVAQRRGVNVELGPPENIYTLV